MKHKIITASLLTVFLTLAFITATHTVAPTSLKFTEPTTSLNLILTPPTGNQTHTYQITFPQIAQDNQVFIDFTSSGDITDINSAQTITISANVNYDEISVGKTYSGNIEIVEFDSNNTLTNDKIILPISFIGSFCSDGEIGTDLEIRNVDMKNSDGDDDEWSPLDEIEIEVEVSNRGDEKLSDVFVELGLFDENGRDITRDLDSLDDEQIDLGSIKDGDKETALFKFTIPADFEDGNYKLVVKTFSDDSALGEDMLCVSRSSDLSHDFYQTISGERETDEDRHVIFSNIKVEPSPAQCGETVQLTGEVANIGDEDYEDQVKVTLVNSELKLNLEKIVRGDLDEGDSELVDFDFVVPKNAQEKSYTLEFRTYYDYDEDNDEYDITSDRRFTQQLTVEGNCLEEELPPTTEVKDVVITAQLDPETPEAIAGKQVVINANLKNTGTKQTNYILSVTGNTEWSNLVSIDPQILILAPGESREANVVLNILPTASGEKTFSIKTSFDGMTKEQKVTILIGQTQEPQIGPIIEHIRNNWFIYLIIVVNIILIIAIILVIRSMVAPKETL
ncbi:putative S-layer protein [Candidatus Pacearchaeota archaeon]|nr:putative S-layer protein [Candidatus Pacearchaeota archaeon]